MKFASKTEYNKNTGQTITSDIEISSKKLILYPLIATILFIAFMIVGVGGCKEFARYQKRADARNDTKVRYQQVKTYEGQVKIEEQKANVKRAEAKGIRDAQDTIALTLTPLYLQHEAIQAMETNAEHGNTIVYIPSGDLGVPLTGQFDVAAGK